MSMRWFAAVAGLALAVAFAGTAGAQEKAGKAAAAKAEKQARAAFKEAVAKYDAEDYEAAVALFREAYELNPSWKLLYNVGQCEAARKRHGEALDAFEQYLSRGGDEVPAERREEVLAEVKRLREMSGSIEIAAPDGALVIVDGTERGRAPLSGRIRVAAGVDHAVRVELDGAALLERNVRVGGGEELVVDARPAQEPPAPQITVTQAPPADAPEDGVAERERTIRTVGWVAVGVGAAALVAGAVTGGLALSANGSVEDACAGNSCTEDQRGEVDRRDALAATTDVLLFTGGAIAVTGAVLLIVFRDRESAASADVAVVPVVGPSGTGAAATWRF